MPRNPSLIEPKIVESDEDGGRFRAWLETAARTPSEAGTSRHARIRLVEKLLNDYDHLRMSRACTDPVDAIRYRMQELGMRQKDLAPLLGGKNRVSEILARRRPLTLSMVRALTQRLGIPADLLIMETRECGPLEPPATKVAAQER